MASPSRLDGLVLRAQETNTANLLTQYQKGAVARGLEFTLSAEQCHALFNSACYYCGFQQKHRFNGIDRVDKQMGYTVGNSVACCKWCNRAKGRESAPEFLSWLRWVEGYRAEPRIHFNTPEERVVRWHDVFMNFPQTDILEVPVESVRKSRRNTLLSEVVLFSMLCRGQLKHTGKKCHAVSDPGQESKVA